MSGPSVDTSLDLTDNVRYGEFVNGSADGSADGSAGTYFVTELSIG